MHISGGAVKCWTAAAAAASTPAATSTHSPHVAGMATLLFNAFPGASQATVHDCIVNTATTSVRSNPDNPNRQSIARGLVDLEAAYRCVRGNPTCPSTGLPPCVHPRSGELKKDVQKEFLGVEFQNI